MAVSIARRQRAERPLVLQRLREDWWQLRRAMEAKRPETALWRLQSVEQAKRDHQLSLAELLVGSGVVR